MSTKLYAGTCQTCPHDTGRCYAVETTKAQLVDALIAEGGETAEVAEQVSLGVQSGGFTMYLDPGRYLVYPIPVESAEAKETP